MVNVHLLVTKRIAIERIAEWLLKENLAVSVEIDWSREHFILHNEELFKETVHKISFITKSSEFTLIEEHIKSEFGEDLKELYSEPIIYHNWNALKDIGR
jgi:uncharacterized protein involved in tolerance to divalent cations